MQIDSDSDSYCIVNTDFWLVPSLMGLCQHHPRTMRATHPATQPPGYHACLLGTAFTTNWSRAKHRIHILSSATRPVDEHDQAESRGKAERYTRANTCAIYTNMKYRDVMCDHSRSLHSLWTSPMHQHLQRYGCRGTALHFIGLSSK
jgi:hypothetical protein